IHLLRHHRRKPVDGGVLLLLQGGIEHRRVVQGIPLPRRLGHLPPPSLQSGFHNYITLSRSPQGETPRRAVGTEKSPRGESLRGLRPSKKRQSRFFEQNAVRRAQDLSASGRQIPHLRPEKCFL